MEEKNYYSSGDYYKETYQCRPHTISQSTHWMANYFKVVKNIFPDINKFKEKRILEIGSSFGGFINILNKKGYKHVQASDMSTELFPKKLKNDFIILDLTNCEEQKNKSFDLILAFDVMEHINDTEKAVKNIKNLLSDKGIFIFCVPYPIKKHILDNYHTNMQLPHYYTNLFYRYGFKCVKIEDISFVPYIWRLGIPMFIRKILKNNLIISETFFVFQKK